MIVVYLEYCQIRIYSGHNNSYNDNVVFLEAGLFLMVERIRSRKGTFRADTILRISL